MKKLFFLICKVCIVFLISSNGCSSSGLSAQIKKPIGEDIPPGSVIVKCEFLNSKDDSNFYLLDIKVKEVLGYGSATETIAAGTDMKIQIVKRLMELKSMKKGTELKFELRQPKMSMNNEQDGIWTVVRIINN